MLIPTTFECRPTAPGLSPRSLPDELMIDWVGFPAGSTASIYLPGADADEVLDAAGRLYGGQYLTRGDAYTVICEAANVSYIPIPSGSASNYAGLLTVDLPPKSADRGTGTVIVRQITSVQADRDTIRAVSQRRRVLSSFQVAVPIEPAEQLLEPEERLFAFFQWILSTLNSGDRWYPVIERYVCQLGNRVETLGGNPVAIPPSPVGAIPTKPGHHPGGGHHPPGAPGERSGKIESLIYDRFGDFVGFILRDDLGADLSYHTRERHLAELARWTWQSQFRVTVISSAQAPAVPVRMLLHAPPAV
jgi:hypothetical protein